MPTLRSPRTPARRIETVVFRRWSGAVLLAFFSALAAGVSTRSSAQLFDTAPALDFHTALREAQTRSHALRAKDAAYQSASEIAVFSTQLSDPMLRLSIDNLPVDGPMRFSLDEDFMTMHSIGLTQTFTPKVKRLARGARATGEARVAQTTRAMELTALQQQTARAWFDRYYQQQLVELLDQRRVEIMLQIEAADVAFRAGFGTQAELVNARLMLADTENLLLKEQSRLANSITSLVRWVGQSGNAPLGTSPTTTHLRSTAFSFPHTIELHPDVAVLTSLEAVALAEVEVARQEKRVDWTATFMYGRRGPSFSDMVTVGISVPIQWNQKNRQDREMSAKLANVQQARAMREEMERDQQAQVEQRLSTWQSNLERLEHFTAFLIPLARERVEAALAEYRGGRSSLSAVIESRRAVIDMSMELLRLEWETAALWAELEYLYPYNAESNEGGTNLRSSASIREMPR